MTLENTNFLQTTKTQITAQTPHHHDKIDAQITLFFTQNNKYKIFFFPPFIPSSLFLSAKMQRQTHSI